MTDQDLRFTKTELEDGSVEIKCEFAAFVKHKISGIAMHNHPNPEELLVAGNKVLKNLMMHHLKKVVDENPFS